MTTIKRRYLTALVFLTNGILLFLCLRFFVARSLNNDDWIIHGITSGAYGVFSNVTAHTSILLSGLLALLQQTWPLLNWFAILEVALCLLSFSLISSIALLKNRNIYGIITAAILAIFIAFDFYLLIHNTKISITASTVGILCLSYGSKNMSRFFTIAGSVLTLFASLIRFNAFLIGATIALFLVFTLMLVDTKDAEARSEKRFWPRQFLRVNRKEILSLSICLTIIMVFYGIDYVMINHNEAAKDYRRYNELRGAVSDFALADYGEYAEAFSAIGITANDYSMISSWNFSDREKFDESTLRNIVDISKQQKHGNFFEQLKQLSDSVYLWLLLISILLIALFGNNGQRRTLVAVVAALLLALMYMAVVGRFTHWVLSGVIASAAVALLTIPSEVTGRPTESKPKGAVTVIYLAVFIIAAIPAVVRYRNHLGSYSEGFHQSVIDIYVHLRENSSDIYLIDNTTNPSNEIHQIIPTFSALEPDIYFNCYSLGGWDTASPAKNSILERYRITGSIFRALLERDNVFLVDVKDYEQKLMYIRENYDQNASVSLYDVVDGYYVFAFTEATTNFLDVQVEAYLTIIDTAVEVDSVNDNFRYCGVKLQGFSGKVEAVYLKLTDNVTGSNAIYRARLIEGNEEIAVVTSLRMIDLLIPTDYSVSVILKTEQGYLSSPSEPLGY
ncbi:MAG: hypothetical protein FWG21_00920 [Oscillospiraceae bacterium]|nr:hypothetical protein [Oscillospiraceae bacterium]